MCCGNEPWGRLVSALRSALFIGTVMHARRDPHDDVFRYPVYMTLLDLDELPRLDRELALFGWNRPGGDELPRPRPLDIRAFLGEQGIELGAGRARSRCSPTCACSATSSTRSRSGGVDVPDGDARVHRRRGQQHLRRAAALPPAACRGEQSRRANGAVPARPTSASTSRRSCRWISRTPGGSRRPGAGSTCGWTSTSRETGTSVATLTARRVDADPGASPRRARALPVDAAQVTRRHPLAGRCASL